MSGVSPSRRHLSIWLPFLPTDRIRRDRGLSSRFAAPGDGPALVTVGKRGSALRLSAADAAARALGLAPGLALADAQAMYPALDIVPEDAAADRTLLEWLAEGMEAWTPLVALDPPDGLLLDITGCAHLFDGEVAMAAAIRRQLNARGIHARIAVAGTVGCASALARHGAEVAAARGRERALLAPLPLAALRLDDNRIRGLEEAGLETVADLLSRPRAPLAARYGAVLLHRLDQALGLVDEPISPRRPVPEYLVERRLLEPIGLESHILAALAALGDLLGGQLETAGLGAARIEASLFRVDGKVERLTVGASRPLVRGDEMRRLFADRLAALKDGVEAGFGFELIRLAAVETARRPPRQPGFDGAAALDAEQAFAGLVDHLTARLGAAQVRRLAPRDSHVPERAMALAGAGDRPPPAPAPAQDSQIPARPFRLFERPEAIEALAEVPDGPPRRFRWRSAWHQVARAEGPERIATEWWQAADDGLPTRDYFRIETEAGLRLWLFRAGLYGRETDRPSWHLHGVFL
ncbi:Y-family DNA polymerase [Zavarzinia compransoris]|uniref:UmuC domain-containing protein n=1 Tax=Zavarzinia compransoris TaxID=1264899 RepID=A0A317EAS8_9PROT|nr:DNA polymerase Y family protein [Zavarzinia compransoris]PWR23801.1 hypothetical protein DKG75_04360 [Zavarzinia compransoris]TDP48032.1 protein ImuB [Zavarzinia compransoris]